MTDQVLEPSARAALRAIVSRLIPADELGPGGAEAGADEYIAAALGGALGSLAADYRAGLAEVDRLSLLQAGRRFAELDQARQDELLGSWAGTPFFETVREHTIEGFLCDPAHGGNRNRVGWSLIGYPPS